MTQVPALREALQDAARRRYGRRRWGRLLIAAPVAGTLVAGILLVASRSPDRETVATPTAAPTATPTPAVYTVKVTPLPTPEPISGPPLIVRARILKDAHALFKAEGGTSNGTLERAWATPGMQGKKAHVFLFRRGGSRCLSVADPGASEPGDRGVSCSPPDVFERFGVSLTIGPNYAAVVPDPKRPPTYRHADGTRETLTPIEGLVALARTESGSAVALYAPDGKRRTDAFRADQRQASTPHNRHECSNGETILVPAIELDEDSMLLAQHRTASETQRHAPRSRESRRVSIFSTTSRAAFGRRPAARGSLRSPCSPANTGAERTRGSSVPDPGHAGATSTAGIEGGGVARRATRSSTPSP